MNNYAISSDGIATALQDSASALMEAGNNLEQSVALVASANKVVQDPNSVGSALRTISLRLRGTSVSVLDELGEETDGAVESVSKMQEKIEALTGVNILTNSGAYKDTYTILREIGEVWEDMSDIDQAALLELMAGKNRANTLAAILGNMEDLEGAYNDALQAEGSALKENAAYLDSIQGRIDLFSNAMQTMWMNFLNADVIRFAVDLGTSLLKVVDTVGVLNTAIAGLSIGSIVKNSLKKNDISLLDAIFEKLPTKIAGGVTKTFDSQLGGLANKKVKNLVSSGVEFTDYAKYAQAIKDVSAAKQAEILINNGVAESEQLLILTKNLGNEVVAKQAIANAKLAISNASVSASMVGTLVNTGALTAEQANAAIATIGLVTAEGESVVVTKADALAKLQAAVATRALEKQDYDAIVATLGLGAANTTTASTFGLLAKSIWSTITALAKFLFLTPVGWGILAVTAIAGVIAAYNAFGPTHENFIEKLEEETEGLKSVQTELENVQSELEATKSRMDELQSKGTLSFVEEEELERLKQQTAELERQEQILQTQEKRARNKQAEAAINAMKTDSDFNGTDWLSIFAGVVSNTVTGSTGLTSEALGSAHNVNKYENNLEDLKKAKEDLDKANEELANTTYKAESKEYKQLEKNVTEAQARVDKYNNAIDSMNDTWLTKYGEIGYIENASTKAEKQWNKLYHQHQDYLDQQALINGDYGKATVLDRIFGITGTDVAKKFKKEFDDAVNSGKDPFDVINDLFKNKDYSSAFSGLEEQFGITMDNIKDYFTQTGEFKVDPEFDITKYTKYISAHSAAISEYQEAIQKLGKGSFTMDDFMALIEKSPELAKGVDISSNAFYGLSKNLNKAIKSHTKDFIDDLEKLKDSLEAAGKETDSVDQLIEAIKKMPGDSLDDSIQKYQTLADAMDEARVAQNQLLASMEENPNEGYETRGEAMEYMKAALKNGEIGSESNVWNVASRYGFTYDSAASINENADALAQFIAVREKWYKQDDDGNYTYKGTESFIEAVETAVDNNTELQKYLKWSYDETTGSLSFDYENKNLPKIIELLSQTEGLVGINKNEWMDLMVQVGQYFDIKWGNYSDAVDHLNEIANGASDAKTKIEEYGAYMQEYFGENTEIDLTVRPMVSGESMRDAGWDDFDGDYATVYSGGYASDDGSVVISATPILPDGNILSPDALEKYAKEIANGTDPAEVEIIYKDKETGKEKKYSGEDIVLNKFEGSNAAEKEAQYGKKLSEAQAGYDALRDTLGVADLLNSKGIAGLKEIEKIQSAISTNSKGATIVDQEAFTAALKEAEYTEDHIDILLEKIKDINEGAVQTDTWKIGETLTKKGLDGLQEIEKVKDSLVQDASTGLTVFDTDMFSSVLAEAGYTKTQIEELIQKIQEYQNIVSVSSGSDPLGLNSANLSIDTFKASLRAAGIEFGEYYGKLGDGLKDIKINVPDLVSTLKANNWTDEAIKAYCYQLSQTNIPGFQVKVDPTEVDAAIAKANEIPETENTTYTVDGTGLSTVQNINNEWANVPREYSTDYTINETTVKSVEEAEANGTAWWNPFGWFANGTAHAQGTAFNTGSWGAPESETALVGELGPELLVRNGRWTTVGDNGAEFTKVKRGDIIFNHKQTESLLKNGYVTGRGKAYASGNAFASGGGTFSRYDFSGDGGYVKYDVNGNALDKFGNAASSLSDAADSLSDSTDEFKEVFDWIEVRLEELEETIGLLNAQLENATYYGDKNNILDNIIAVNKTKLENLNAGYAEYTDYATELLSQIPAKYRDAAKNGAIAIEKFVGEADETTLEAIQNYREWAQKAADLKQQAEEIITEIRDLAIQKFDNAYESGDVRATVEDSQTEKLQNAVDYDEERGLITSDAYYIAMMENSNKKIEYLTEARKAMQAELNAAVEAGQIKRGSNEWYELLDKMYQVDSQIDEATIELEEFQNAINDIYWDNFDQLINRLDYIKEETQNLIDLMGNEDMVVDPVKRKYENGTIEYWTADDVQWSKEGLASLGLYAQQMEIAEYKAKQYAKAIDDLTKEYNAGHYSENEYLEKLNELKDGQYENIEAYYDAQEAIKDLNETRIDSIKKGIDKEIEAYEELIKAKKELLDSEKDAHDFQKTVLEQQKNISDIERKLAALAYDNSASARAKRAQLEAELAEARNELDETYYDRSIEDQQNALDRELENFQKEKDDEVTKMEEYLEDIKQVVADSLTTVQANASGIYDTLTGKAEEYNLTLSESIMTPWQDGSLAVSDYQETFDTAMSSTMNQLEALKNKWQEVIDKMAEAGKVDVSNINTENANYASATYKEPAKPATPTPKQDDTITVGSMVNAGDAPIYTSADSDNGAQQYFKGDPVYKVINITNDSALVRHGSQTNGVTGWFKIRDLKLEKYANGTKSVPNDQWSIIDELGDELRLIPDGNGRLAYMKKGTGVVPADLTANLMEWGKLDPTNMLDQNRPQIGVSPSVVNSTIEINIDASVGELLHVEHIDGSNPAEIGKIVDKAWDKHMKELNAHVRRYTNR